MPIHSPGAIYLPLEDPFMYLGVNTLDGRKQLIRTSEDNLLGIETKLLIFDDLQPALSYGTNPLADDYTEKIGQLNAKKIKIETYMKIRDKLRTDDMDRKILGATLFEEEAAIILPRDFQGCYSLYSLLLNLD